MCLLAVYAIKNLENLDVQHEIFSSNCNDVDIASSRKVFVSVSMAYLLLLGCKYFYVAACDRKEHAISPHYYLTKWTPPNKGISDLTARSARVLWNAGSVVSWDRVRGAAWWKWSDQFIMHLQATRTLRRARVKMRILVRVMKHPQR